MKLTFIGATHEVTGSCTCIETNGETYLVDYGMRQGREIFQTCALPVSPEKITAVFLTHAHIDHSGMLPKLYKDGFRGNIYTTSATAELCKIMLEDSAHILNSELEWKNRKRERSGLPPLDADYLMEDAAAVCSLFYPLSYNQKIKVSNGVNVTFSDIGHLLGSASIRVEIEESGLKKSMVFSGDVGNFNHPIIKDPLPIQKTDYLLIESTYGTRLHSEATVLDPYKELADIITKAFSRGGNVIIPSFAVGRTQEILYIIRGIKERGLVKDFPHFPVYLDSPLAVEATEVFMKCDHSYFDKEMRELIDSGVNPIMNDDLHFSVTSEESKMINFIKESKVIISSSGMCDAGRIRHHLKHNLWKKENIILFVGYQAEGSLGRVIIDGKKTVKLFGEEVAVKAEIKTMHGTSSHADKEGLLNWIEKIGTKPDLIFINHGEESACEGFKDILIEKGYNAYAPYSGTTFDMLTKEIIPVEPKRIENTEGPLTRPQILFNALLDSVEELEAVARSLKGHQNRDVTSMTSQIKQIISRWKE